MAGKQEKVWKHLGLVAAWNSHATTRHEVFGPIFADCTGDGVLRMSGAKFRQGRENPKEFGETYLPAGSDSGTMGSTIMLQLRRTPGEDRPFRAPEWAYKFTERDMPDPGAGRNVMCNGVRVNVKKTIPRNNSFWWVEYGGVIDTIGDANAIQLELKKIAYGACRWRRTFHGLSCRPCWPGDSVLKFARMGCGRFAMKRTRIFRVSAGFRSSLSRQTPSALSSRRLGAARRRMSSPLTFGDVHSLNRGNCGAWDVG